MYQSPDIIKVSVDVKDTFAAYTVECPADNQTVNSDPQPCYLSHPGDAVNYHYVNGPEPFVLGEWCYTLLDAPAGLF